MDPDRVCHAEFPREETEAHLPWAFGLSHTLDFMWLFWQLLTHLVFVACQCTSENRSLILPARLITRNPGDVSVPENHCVVSASHLLPPKQPRAEPTFLFTTTPRCKMHLFHICFAVRCFWHTRRWWAGEKWFLFLKADYERCCSSSCQWVGAKNGVVGLLSKLDLIIVILGSWCFKGFLFWKLFHPLQ